MCTPNLGFTLSKIWGVFYAFLICRYGSASIINELRDNNWYTHVKALLKKQVTRRRTRKEPKNGTNFVVEDDLAITTPLIATLKKWQHTVATSSRG